MRNLLLSLIVLGSTVGPWALADAASCMKDCATKQDVKIKACQKNEADNSKLMACMQQVAQDLQKCINACQHH